MKVGFQCSLSNLSKRWGAKVATLLSLAAMSTGVFAQSADPKPWQLNMGKGVTQSSQIAYDSHMIVLGICVVIGLIVFSAMAYAMFRFRHSKGAVADTQFTHSTKLEIIWTLVPVVLLVAMAWPATANLIKMYDTRNATMTVKVTGYQWMWKYEYLGEGVEFTSRLDKGSDAMRQSGKTPSWNNEADRNYLLDVDNVLVLPVDTKVRFVITADDVIHAWWVPALGWKQDAIPGIVNEAWTDIKQPGIYRGQCAELCGKDHGFMPIVVKAVPQAEFEQWLAAEKAKRAPAAPEAVAASAVDAASSSASGTAPSHAAAPDPSTDPTPEASAPAQPAAGVPASGDPVPAESTPSPPVPAQPAAPAKPATR
jgi:cytochrome c oxidase subunit 2